MTDLRPVKLTPAFKDYIWGGTRLKTEYNKKSDLERVAESWELSTHRDGQSLVAEGELKGITLSEYIEKNPGAVGANAAKFDFFPILIKLIDARDNLSIQVHPNDEYSLAHNGEYGKTEMWYVLDAEPGAFLYYGFNRRITREEYRRRIENNTLLEVLNRVEVKKGDVFFIESGTVHAICAGIVICEIQQNSNTTYRVYDYDRRDKDGRPRPLHIDNAIEVSSLEPAPELKKPNGAVLAKCRYFTVEKYDINGKMSLKADKSSFRSVVVIDGEAELRLGETVLSLKKGDSVFIPAQDVDFVLDGSCSVIASYV